MEFQIKGDKIFKRVKQYFLSLLPINVSHKALYSTRVRCVYLSINDIEEKFGGHKLPYLINPILTTLLPQMTFAT